MPLRFDQASLLLALAVLTSCAKMTERNNPLDPNRTSGGGVGTLTGAVQDGNGTALSDVSVVTDPVTSTATTDANGRYTFLEITSGAYSITAKKSAFIKASISVTVEPDTTTTAQTITVNAGPSFAGAIQPIFNANCTTTNCHSGGSPAGGYLLTTYNGATSQNVNPFDSDASLIFTRISGNSAGAQMPQSLPALSSANQQSIKDWIDSGAPNN